MRTKLSSIAAAAMAMLLFAACAGKPSEAERITGDAPPETSPESSKPADLPTPLAITATELANDRASLEIQTGAVPAGQVAITLLNVGTDRHDVSFVKIVDGDFEKFKAAVELQGLAAALASNPVVAGPIEASAGDSDKETVTLEPGVYAVLSTRTTSDGKSLAERGMLTKLTVEPETDATDVPATDA